MPRAKGFPIDGEKLSDWYKRQGLNQREFALRLGMTDVGLRLIERGTTKSVQARTLRAIAEVMGKPPEEAARFFAPSEEAHEPPDFAALAHAHNLTVEQLHAAVQTALETGRWPEITRATAGERAETIEKTADSLTALGVVERGKRRTKG